jgi:hypothetical protein
MQNENEIPTDHLTDQELFALAVPPAGAPEPLPVHLSDCLQCSRSLADWKKALSEIGREDGELIAGRSAEEWRAAEDATLAAIRRAGAQGHGRARTLRWALPAAAALALFAVLIAGRSTPAPEVFDDPSGLSAQDRADDALLRDVDRLASGEDATGGWNELVPDPANPDATPGAEKRS